MLMTPKFLPFLDAHTPEWAGNYLTAALQAEEQGKDKLECHRLGVLAADSLAVGPDVPAIERPIQPGGWPQFVVDGVWAYYLKQLEGPAGSPLPDLPKFNTVRNNLIRQVLSYWWGKESLMVDGTARDKAVERTLAVIRGAFLWLEDNELPASWKQPDLEFVLGKDRAWKRAKGFVQLSDADKVFREGADG